jgi:hypothetical protein
MRIRLVAGGGPQRVILCTGSGSFYLAVRILGRYYRLAMGPAILGGIYVGRS